MYGENAFIFRVAFSPPDYTKTALAGLDCSKAVYFNSFLTQVAHIERPHSCAYIDFTRAYGIPTRGEKRDLRVTGRKA